MVRVYYDLVLWEEIDDKDEDRLKGKFAEMGNRFKGYGVLSFAMRAAPAGQPQQTIEQQPAEAEGTGEESEPEYEYVDEKGNPVEPTEDDTIVDE